VLECTDHTQILSVRRTELYYSVSGQRFLPAYRSTNADTILTQH